MSVQVGFTYPDPPPVFSPGDRVLLINTGQYGMVTGASVSLCEHYRLWEVKLDNGYTVLALAVQLRRV